MALQDFYTKAAKGAQAEMFLVGKVGEFKRSYGRQTREWKFFDYILKELSIDKVKVSQLTTAYNFYNKMIDNTTYSGMISSATPYQLYALKQGDRKGSSVVFDTCKYFEKHNRLPSVSKINQRANGKIGSDFKDLLIGDTKPSNSDDVVLKPVSPTTQQAFINRQQAIERLVEDTDKPFLNNISSAGVYQSSGRFDCIKAATQHIVETDTMTAEMEKAVDDLFKAVVELKSRASSKTINAFPMRMRR